MTPDEREAQALAYERAAVDAVIAPIAVQVTRALAVRAVETVAPLLRRITWTPIAVLLDRWLSGAVQLGVRTGLDSIGQDISVPVRPPDTRTDLDSIIRTRLDSAASLADSGASLDSIGGRARSGVSIASGAVRGGVNSGINSGIADVARAAGQRVLWVAERNGCLHCLAYSGWATEPDQAFPAGLTFDPAGPLKPFGPLLHPPLHPNCFPAGSIVSGPGVRATFKRWYAGEMVEIRARSGRVLSGTPNHPVLTDQGWVPIGLLREGAHVVGDGGLDRMLASDPHDYQQPTRIEDVTRTIGRASGVPVVSVPVSAEDFHGDVTHAKVDVVRTDRALRDRRQVTQPLSQQQFGRGSANLSNLSGLGAARKSLDAIALSAPGIVSGGGEPGPFGRVGVRHTGSHRGGSVAQLHTGPGQESGEGGAADAALFRKRLDALSGLVSLDQVIAVRRYPFAGHVYNLETSGGWYICNGITVHNCRCRLRPYEGPAGAPSGDRSRVDPASRLYAEARRSVVYQWTDYASGPAMRRAAAALLGRGADLPDSVERRARAALERGREVRRPR